MSNYTLAEYESAVLAALADLKLPPGPLSTLEGYSGQINLSEEGVLVFLRGFPAVLVEITGADYATNSMPFYTSKVTVTLYVVARSWRDQDESRGGPTGAYTILDSLRTALLENTLSLDIRSCGLQIVSEKRIAADQTMVIYTAEYVLWNDRVTAA